MWPVRVSLNMRARLLGVLVAGSYAFVPSSAQQPPSDPAPTSGTRDRAIPTNPPEPEHKRIFGIIPNYRTYPSLAEYEPITAKQKFKLAADDSFDRGTFVLAAAFAGEGQLSNANPSFGQGVEGYAHYFVTSYADFAIGDFMTEAIYPTLLHQDPRYFRRGTGSKISRLGYAVGQIFWTHRDSGGSEFNFSEIVGNSTAAVISNAYYPEGRTVGQNLSKLGVQVGLDMTGNVLKEFWPDLSDWLARKHRRSKTSTSP
jgi:hypothetical protein